MERWRTCRADRDAGVGGARRPRSTSASDAPAKLSATSAVLGLGLGEWRQGGLPARGTVELLEQALLRRLVPELLRLPWQRLVRLQLLE